jgi:hypothetical protein
VVLSVVILASQRCRAVLCRHSPAIAHGRVTLLESADPENAPVTRLESALPKSLDLKPFRIRTYENWRGRGQIVNQKPSAGCAEKRISECFPAISPKCSSGGVGALAPTSSGWGNLALAPEELFDLKSPQTDQFQKSRLAIAPSPRRAFPLREC